MVFRLHAKFLIVWIPTKLTGFHLQKCINFRKKTLHSYSYQY